MSAKFRFDNMDASESVFFSRQLEHIRPQALEVKFADLKAKELVPMETGIDAADQVYTYRYFESFGAVAPAGDYSANGPRVGLKGSEASQKMAAFINSYAYSLEEMRKAMKSGMDLSSRSAVAARLAHAQKIDDVMLSGDSAQGLLGLFNLSGTSSYSVPNGAGGSQSWNNKTPDEIVADMNGIANGIVADSKEIHKPDTLVLPLTAYNQIASKRMGDGSDATILRFFLGQSSFIKNVVSSYKLETAGSGSSRRMVAYSKDPSMVAGLLPLEFEQLAPQSMGWEVVTHCRSKMGGVVAFYPKSISYGDSI